MTARIEGVRIHVTEEGTLVIEPMNPHETIVFVPPFDIRNRLVEAGSKEKHINGTEALNDLRIGPDSDYSYSKGLPKEKEEEPRASRR